MLKRLSQFLVTVALFISEDIHLKPLPDKLSTTIDAGVKLAIAKAIERHRRLGESISIWQDGKVVTLTADQIPPADSTVNHAS